MFKIITIIILLIIVIITIVGRGDGDGIDDYMYYNGHKYYRKK